MEKTVTRAPALYIHGGNWYSGPGLYGLMESVTSRIYSIQRNRIYQVLLTQTKHLDKVSSDFLNLVTSSFRAKSVLAFDLIPPTSPHKLDNEELVTA